jgi:hypothetical protein
MLDTAARLSIEAEAARVKAARPTRTRVTPEPTPATLAPKKRAPRKPD